MEANSFARSDGGLTVPRSRRLLSAFGDERLIAQLRRGNEAAFEVLFDRHHAGVLSYCRHMLGSRDEAEDAVQQAFVSAHADIVASDKPIRFKAWIYTIARNRCLSVLRSRREQPSDDIERVSTAGLGEEVQQRADLRELLGDLQELPESQRDALILSELGALSHAEVAEIIDCEVAKVKSLVFQARAGLLERREARETPCHEIREQLSTLRGGSLRRGPLRRHLKACPGCTEFREEVRRQRQALAALLPVVPTIALKENALAAVGIGAGSAATGMLAGGGAGAIFTAKAGVTQVAVIAVATTGIVGGAVTLDRKVAVDADRRGEAESAQGGSQASASPSAAAGAAAPGRESAAVAASTDRPRTLAETVRMSVTKAGLGPGPAGGLNRPDTARPGGEGQAWFPFAHEEDEDEDDGRFESEEDESEDDDRDDERSEHDDPYRGEDDDEGEEDEDDDEDDDKREKHRGGGKKAHDGSHHDDDDDDSESSEDDEADDEDGDDEEADDGDEDEESGLDSLVPDLTDKKDSKGKGEKDRKERDRDDRDDDDEDDDEDED